MSAFGSHLNVFRRNHEQLQDEYGSNYGREICLDFTEDIIMVRDYLLEKLGRSDAACRRHTTWSEMAERDLDREQVGFHKMLESEQALRDWLTGQLNRPDLIGARGEVPPNLAEELGLTEDELAAMVSPDLDPGADLGGVEQQQGNSDDEGELGDQDGAGDDDDDDGDAGPAAPGSSAAPGSPAPGSPAAQGQEYLPVSSSEAEEEESESGSDGEYIQVARRPKRQKNSSQAFTRGDPIPDPTLNK